MKMKRKNLKAALTLILAITILMLPFEIFASGASLGSTAIPDEAGEAEPVGAGSVAEVNGTGYATLGEAVNAWATGSTLKLMSDVATSSPITVPSGDHTLDLNGYGVLMTGNDRVIIINQGASLVLNDSQPDRNHYISLTNYRGTAVSGSGEQSVSNGNGVIRVTGGYLTGGYRNNSGYHDKCGACVFNWGTFVMNGGNIVGNTMQNNSGGAIRNSAYFTMNGGTIAFNYAAGGGGGVTTYVPGGGQGKMLMTGGVISDNSTPSVGGGLVLAGPFEMTGGSVVRNTANAGGSGIYYGGQGERFKLSGDPVIKDNTNDDLYMDANATFMISGSLAEGADVRVLMKTPAAFTVGWKSVMGSADPSKYFKSGNSNYAVILNNNGEAEIGTPPAAGIVSGGTITYYNVLSDAVNAWTAGSTLKLLSDVSNDVTITVPSGKHILDLNGYTLLELSTIGKFMVGAGASATADLTIIDSVGTGVIQHETSRPGSLIWIKEGSSLTLDGGTLQANSSASPVIDFFQQKNVSFTMNGGKITGTANNGAVRFGSNCTFTMTGGEISGLQTSTGLFDFSVGSGGAINISGNPVVKNNTANGTVCNFNLPDGRLLNINGEMTDSASIGVTKVSETGVFTSGWKAIMGSASPSKYFTSDNDSYPVFLNESGEAEIGIPPVVPNVSATGFDGDYDGAAHSVTVSAPDGATVGFGTKEGSYTLTESPNYTNAGAYTVYYEVSKENYTSVYGSAQVIINKINVTVTITGHTITVDYDGNAHSADGYDVSASSALYDVTKDYTYSGRAEAVRTDAGTTDMGLTASDFTNKNSNFNTVTFDVTDGYIKVEPINATVTITGHTNTVDYDGNAHSADGYDAQSSTDLYDVTKDFIYNGKAEAVRTYAGTTYMGLTAENFQNTNSNFATVTFNVTDGYQTVNKVDSVLTTAPRSNTGLVYSGSAQSLLTAGAATGGTLYYAFGSDDDTAPSGGYKTAVPTATDVGNYYVWYLVEGDGNHNSISPACIKVTIAEKEWITITGKVVDSNNNPVKDATVSLTLGGRTVDAILSGSDGGYYFTVPAGLYNIVVKTNESTVTDSVDISQTSVYDIAVPNADTDSLLDVVDSDKNIVVGGLNKEADTIRSQEGIAPDKNVTVKMTVTPVYSSSTDAAAAIEEFASDRYVECYDFRVEKTVDTQTTYLDSTQNVLEIAIPCSFTSKREMMVYLYDGSSVSTLTESDSKQSGTFRVDAATGMIYLYANKISTYAIGYKPYYSVKSTFSLGDFTGIATVELSKDGETVVKLNDVPLDNVSFSGISKGIYSMTVTWIDGAENSLTLPFTIK